MALFLNLAAQASKQLQEAAAAAAAAAATIADDDAPLTLPTICCPEVRILMHMPRMLNQKPVGSTDLLCCT
jgi:hypothetical protein